MRKKAIRDYRNHIVKARKTIASIMAKTKGNTNKIVKTMLKDMAVSDNRCQQLMTKVDEAEFGDKALKKADMEAVDAELGRIEANSKAVDALLIV